MRQIINFIIRFKNFLLYVLLLLVSLGFTVQSHAYHQSKFFNSSSWLTGSVYQTMFNITSYFDLKDENKKLAEENLRLQNLLLNQKKEGITAPDPTTAKYTVTAGQVIKNSFADSRNYITINKGKRDGVQPDMGVITSNGVVGIVENTSNKFASVQSILNENSKINAKLKNTNHFGSLVWDQNAYDQVQLIDITRSVTLHVGDTVVTGGMSSIFPENIPIGTIKKFDLDSANSYWHIDVALFNDMTNLKNVYIINNLDRPEILQLEIETTKNDQ